MTNKSIDKIPHYTESIFYELKQTARVLSIYANQLAEKLNLGMPPISYTVLDTIMCNPNICQRDLAKLIVLDRANTGKILNNLEEKHLIIRAIDTKNNRLVKKCSITQKGIDELKNLNEIIFSYYKSITEKIPEEEFQRVRLALKNLRTSFEQHIQNKI